MRLGPRKARRRGRRKQRLHPLAIAGIMIAVTIFITFYAFNQGLPFVHQYTMHAIVNNSLNVRSESPVRIAGINVGTVSSTSPDGPNTKITFTVQNDGLPIHTDATITVRDRLFLEGSYYLQLDPGTPRAPLATDGYTFQIQHTASPVQFYKLLSTFDQAARTSLGNALTTLNTGFSPVRGISFYTSGAGGLKRAIPQLTPLLKDVAWVSQSLTGTHANDVERLLSSGAKLTGALNDDGANLNSLISGLNRTSQALVANGNALASTVQGLDQTVRISPSALSAIDRSLPPLTNLARALTPSLKVSPPIVQLLTGAVQELTTVVRPVARRRLLTALHTTLTEFPTVLTQLGRAFPATESVTNCLRTHVVPILNAKINDGAHSTGNPVWQDFVHFLPSVAGASGSFDGNGHYTRVLLGVGDNSLTGGLASSLSSALGKLSPLVGLSPGGGTIEGASPAWVGDLVPGDFRPDAECGSQALPSLAATAGSGR